MNFNELKLDGRILKAVKAAGYETPSPIQEKAIPPALDGRDVLGCAQTGTGKTAAFALPILNNLNGKPQNRIRALVLTPTRELALQIEESFQTYGKYLPYRCGVVMGGVSQQKQIELLKRGVDVLVATPGRLLDLHAQGLADLSGLEFFVLDEADRMLDMGFIHDVKKVIALLPRRRQTMFFTATLPPEIVKLAKSLLVNPVDVAVTPVSSTVELTEQLVYFTDKASKDRSSRFSSAKRCDRGLHARLYAYEIRCGQTMPKTQSRKDRGARHSRRPNRRARGRTRSTVSKGERSACSSPPISRREASTSRICPPSSISNFRTFPRPTCTGSAVRGARVSAAPRCRFAISTRRNTLPISKNSSAKN